MLEEVLVVARRVVVRARVRAAALLARDPGLEHAGRDVEQVAELDRLRQVGVEDVALVLDDDGRVALAQPVDDLDLLGHLVLAPEDAEVLQHRLAELVADLPGPLALLAAEQRLQLALGVAGRRLRDGHGRVRERPFRGRPAGAAAERDRLHQRVAAEAVGTVDGDAGDLAGGVEPGHLGQAVGVGLDAAHVVVGARPDRDRLVNRIDAGVDHRQLARAGQARQDLLRAEVGQVEEDGAVDAAPFVDLGLLGTGDDVARREILRGRGVAHHEALALRVAQDAALAAAALGDQDPAREHRRRVELHELDVLQRQAGAQRHRHAVAGAGIGVRRRAVEPADAACREQDGLAAERLQAAVEKIPGDHALAAALVLDELPGEELLVDLDVALDQLLVEHLDQDVARDVGGEDRSRRAGGAERTLRELAVVAAREDGPPVLELVDVARRLAGEDLDRVLVAEVVRALDGVERVALGAVVARVAEGRVDAAFRRAGVAAGRVELGDDGDVGARVMGFDRRAHACAARPDHEYVVLGVHLRGSYRIGCRAGVRTGLLGLRLAAARRRCPCRAAPR